VAELDSVQVREAEQSDVEDVIEMFNQEYDTYFGKFVEEEELKGHIDSMPNEEEFVDQAAKGEVPVELVVVLSDGDFVGSGSLEVQDDRVELKSTMVREERRQERVDGSTGYEKLFDVRLADAEEIISSEEGPDIAYTQPVSAKTAGTQHVASKKGFVPTGVYDNKYFEVYPGRGRVSVLNMVYADSNFETSSELHLPEEFHEAAEHIIGSINDERSDDLEEVERQIMNEDYNGQYSVRYEILPEPFNIADIKIQPSENRQSLESVVEEIEDIDNELKEHGDDYWMKASLDAESPMASEAAEELRNYGFDYSGLKLDSFNGRETLELQKRPGPKKDRQFISPVLKLIEQLGLEYGEAVRESDYQGSRYVSI
jgi:hypothetical protein